MRSVARGLALLSLLCLASSVLAFQLSPMGTAAERKFAKKWNMTLRAQIAFGESGLHNFAGPVHETLTHRIFGCDGDWADCSDPDLEYAGPFVIAGVRWNDDPVFLLQSNEAQGLPCVSKDTVSFITQTRCWVGLFRAGEKVSAKSPGHFLNPKNGNYMLRSHFGDLQFLHAMASRDGESAKQTKARILMWAQFIWGIMESKYRLDTNLKDITLPGWADHFNNGHAVQELFTLGRPWLRPHVKDVAFGSLLHLVQDSFAAGHVDRREPLFGQTCSGGSVQAYGAIREFHSYASQDHAKHKTADSNESARDHIQLNDPDVIDAGKRLVSFRENRATWDQVSQFMNECVFKLENEEQGATAGDAFISDPS
jgi:hypothetical protein